MALAKMSASDRRVIFECLKASARGPFFSDTDLSILLGLTRQDLLGLVARIPRIDDSEPEVRRAIAHALVDLVAYPHGKMADWGAWISVSPATVEQVYSRWQSLQSPIEYESMTVHGPAFLAGRHFRVVAYTVRGGVEGMSSEVWSGGKWVIPLDGPGCREILSALPVTHEELVRAGVDCSPLPWNYDPIALSCEQAGVPSHLVGWAVAQELSTDGSVYQALLRCPCSNDRLVLSHSGTVYNHQGLPYPAAVQIGSGYHFVVCARCSACGGEKCLFDWGIHGWTGILGVKRAKPTGQEPPLCAWPCSSCRSLEHLAVMQFTLNS
jgi:hypothetical protein